MPVSPTSLNKLRSRAISVLQTNDLGSATRPAPRLYPHQWNWDSGFIAIGLAHIDIRRAQEEVESLFLGQWNNGMIPHIIFNPDTASYFPGPEFWDIHLSGVAPNSPLTSGITQPPVLARSALHVYSCSTDKEDGLRFLDRVYEKLVQNFLFLKDYRSPDKSGFAAIIHPWESGLDNAPNWDTALARIVPVPKVPFSRADIAFIAPQERPTDEDYRRYVALVDLFKRCKYNQSQILRDCPFVVQSVLFNALLCRDLEAMQKIGELLGRSNAGITNWHNLLKNGFDARFLDPESGLYRDFDCVATAPLEGGTFSELLPIITGIPSATSIRRIVDHLTSHNRYWSDDGFPVSTVSHESQRFNPVNYWRGPVWIQINWLFIEGLKRHGHPGLAARLAAKTIQLVNKSGFFEYFHPFTGQGYGSDDFSWTAALIIDLIAQQTTNIIDE